MADYLAEFTAAKAAVDEVVDKLDDILKEPPNQELLARIAGNRVLFAALRYLAAPPISEDDLDTLLDGSVSATAIRRDVEFARELVGIMRATLDPKRFPWVAAGLRPTADQLNAAKLASAVAAAIQRVQTKRRGDEKEALESAVEELLLALSFKKLYAPRGSMDSVEDFPKPGEYMRGATLGGHNGDFVIGLFDRRRLALECKSSNSPINSRKRLNKELIADAKSWTTQFGRQVIAGGALRGVFHPAYVIEAQRTPILIFWSHRLEDLREFIESTRSSNA